MESDYLSSSELRELTGRARPAQQIEWLRSNGWIFALTADARPRVLRGYRNRQLGDERAPVMPVEFEPDFAGLKA